MVCIYVNLEEGEEEKIEIQHSTRKQNKRSGKHYTPSHEFQLTVT